MTSREGPIAAQRARNARLAAQAERLAANDAARNAPDTGRSLPVILLPANTRATASLPDASRAAFLEALDARIANVFVEAARDNDAPMSEEAAAARANAEQVGAPAPHDTLLGAACAACRGECCTAGGTHAFLREDSLVRVRAQLSLEGQRVTPESLLDEYERHLPQRHYRDSCVFHTPAGCALPRRLRSNLCNRYLCGGLTQLTRALDASGADSAYVAPADSVHLRRVALLSPQGTRTLSVREG